MKFLYLLAQIATFTGATVFGFASVMQAYMGGSILAVVFLVLATGQYALLAMNRQPRPVQKSVGPTNTTTLSMDYLDIEHADFSVPRQRADWKQFSN